MYIVPEQWTKTGMFFSSSNIETFNCNVYRFTAPIPLGRSIEQFQSFKVPAEAIVTLQTVI